MGRHHSLLWSASWFKAGSFRPAPSGKGRHRAGTRFGHGHAVAGNQDLLALKHLVEELREVGFCLVDVEGGHAMLLVPNQDYFNYGVDDCANRSALQRRPIFSIDPKENVETRR